MECLRVIAEGELDFLNQEWVINWNETDLIDYVNGDREPNYLYLVKAILADCERELSSNKEVKELLMAYPNTEYKEDIEIALLRAMQEYIKDIM
jgi:outer membrane protein assembly factor BamD (BamD/ComL family)